MKCHVFVSYSIWQEALSETEAIQVVMENIPDIAFDVRAQIEGRVQNPLDLQPMNPREETKQNEAH